MAPGKGVKRRADEMEGDNEMGQGDDRFKVKRAKENEPELEQPDDAGVIPKVHFRWMLSGPSKSGKTNLARWVLDKYYKPGSKSTRPSKKSFFDRIHLLSPTAHIDPIWQGLAGLADKDRHTKPTARTLEKILMDQVKAIQGNTSDQPPKMSEATLHKHKEKAPKVLILMDDAIAESKLINSPAFLKVFIQGRHYNISTMVMSQSYMKVPRSARLQATHVAMFPSRASEIERLYSDHGPKELTKNEFTELVQEATDPTEGDEYPFLYVDVFAPAKHRFRRNFTDVMEIAGREGYQEPERKGTKRKQIQSENEEEEEYGRRSGKLDREMVKPVRKRGKTAVPA